MRTRGWEMVVCVYVCMWLSYYLIAPVGRAAVAGFVDLGLLLHAAALVPLIRPTLHTRTHTALNYRASKHSPHNISFVLYFPLIPLELQLTQ